MSKFTPQLRKIRVKGAFSLPADVNCDSSCAGKELITAPQMQQSVARPQLLLHPSLYDDRGNCTQLSAVCVPSLTDSDEAVLGPVVLWRFLLPFYQGLFLCLDILEANETPADQLIN